MRPLAFVLPLALLLVGCDGGSGPSSTLERSAFVATWVDLRMAALASPSGELDPRRRDEILDARGVTEDDLLEFVETHGRDVDYMREVWAEVEARMDSLDLPEEPPT